jgi:hypothetical protein
MVFRAGSGGVGYGWFMVSFALARNSDLC